MANIRCLQEGDLSDCMRLKGAAGWNQTEADWLALMRFAPQGCFGIEAGGRIAATATAIVHEGVGWIGMVLTDPRHRGQGFATALLEHALAYLDPLAETVKLDATAQGEPLYRRLGFVEEAPIERWYSTGGEFETEPLAGQYAGPLRHPPVPVDAMAECGEAWAAGRAGSNAWYFGPCYARSEAAAERVARCSGTCFRRTQPRLLPSGWAFRRPAGCCGWSGERPFPRVPKSTPLQGLNGGSVIEFGSTHE
jgi:GNAT superfamily N-acetyltransferase